MQIIFNSEFQASRSSITCKRGDDLVLDLVFLDARREAYLPDFDSVVFAGKSQGDYAGDFLFRADEFTQSETVDGTPCLSAQVRINGEILSELMGNRDAITIWGEFEFRKMGYVVSSQTLSLIVSNDVIKGLEGSDNDIAVDYATTMYVDNTVRKHIDAGTIDELQDISAAAMSAAASNAKTLEEAIRLLASVVQSLGGESGPILLGDNLMIQTETVDGVERVLLEMSPNLNVRSLSLGTGCIVAASGTTIQIGDVVDDPTAADAGRVWLGVRKFGGNSTELIAYSVTAQGGVGVSSIVTRYVNVAGGLVVDGTLTANKPATFNDLVRCTSSVQMLGDLQFTRGATGYIYVVSDSAGTVFWLWNDTQNNTNSPIFICSKDQIIFEKRLLTRASPVMTKGLNYQTEDYTDLVTSKIKKDGTLTFSAGATGNVVFDLPIALNKEATRATKANPSENDIMNKAMTDAALTKFAADYGLTKPQ